MCWQLNLAPARCARCRKAWIFPNPFSNCFCHVPRDIMCHVMIYGESSCGRSYLSIPIRQEKLLIKLVNWKWSTWYSHVRDSTSSFISFLVSRLLSNRIKRSNLTEWGIIIKTTKGRKVIYEWASSAFTRIQNYSLSMNTACSRLLPALIL